MIFPAANRERKIRLCIWISGNCMRMIEKVRGIVEFQMWACAIRLVIREIRIKDPKIHKLITERV